MYLPHHRDNNYHRNIIRNFYKDTTNKDRYRIQHNDDDGIIITKIAKFKRNNKNQSLNNVKEQPITVFNNTINKSLNEFNNKVDEKKLEIKMMKDKINKITLPDPPNTNFVDNTLKFFNLNQGDNIQAKKSKIMNLLDNAIKDIENETKDITPQPSEKDIIEKSTKLDLIVNNVEHKVKLFELEKENENNYQMLHGIIEEKEKNLNQLEQDLASANNKVISIIDNKETTIDEQNKIIEDYKNELLNLRTSIENEKKEKINLIKEADTKMQNLAETAENEITNVKNNFILL